MTIHSVIQELRTTEARSSQASFVRSVSPWFVLAIVAIVLVAFVPAQAQLDPASINKPLGDSWPTYSGDYTGRRYSSLTQINQTNVKHLTLAWMRRLTNGPGPAGPRPPGAPEIIIAGEGDGSVTVAGPTQI